MINKKEYIYIYNKDKIISSNFYKKTVYIYNGKNFYKFNIKENYIGLFFNNFIFSKKIGRNIHSLDLKKKQKIKKKK